MGQGYFVEYGYGCILDKDHPLAKDYESGEIYDLTDKARKKWSYDKKPFLRVPYESEDFYISFSLADCGQNQLDDSYPSITNTVFRISEIKKFLESKGIDFEVLDKEWKSVQEEFKAIGYEIPEPEILAIHDYD